MAQKIGIDFGTTNSLISVILSEKPKYFVDARGLPIPSVVSYVDGRRLIGRDAKSQLDDVRDIVNGCTIKSPKKLLGKGPIYIQGREYYPHEIIRDLMSGLKQESMAENGTDVMEATDFNNAVVSIPVAMDGRARKELRDAMLQAGIHIYQFVHEPLAALYAYFRTFGEFKKTMEEFHNKLALVFDWGGGTLDLTLCSVLNGRITQIINIGDNEVGGDYIDEALRSYILEKHINEKGITELPPIMVGARARLLSACESTKIKMSKRSNDVIYIRNFFDVDDENQRDLQVDITVKELNDLSKNIIDRGLNKIDKLLGDIHVDQRRVSLCLATGGMINMPQIEQRLTELFSVDRLVISDHGDKIISEGCAWIAHDNCPITLAKSIEVIEARQSYLTVFRADTHLPIEGDIIAENIDLYCVDPRDGKAKIQLCRPIDSKKSSAADTRINYDNLILKVDSKSKPFHERLTLNMTINDDLILNAEIRSQLTGDSDSCEIYDLEFGLSIPNTEVSKKKTSEQGIIEKDKTVSEGVCSRSNVTSIKDSKHLIPGELLYTLEPYYFDMRSPPPEVQNFEKLYYQPCAICNRRYNDPLCKCASI